MARREGITGNERAQARLRVGERDRKEQARRDLEAVALTAQGRRFLARLEGQGSCYVAGDTHATAYNLGARSVAERVLGELGRLRPDLLLLMRQEQLHALSELELEKRDAIHQATKDGDEP